MNILIFSYINYLNEFFIFLHLKLLKNMELYYRANLIRILIITIPRVLH